MGSRLRFTQSKRELKRSQRGLDGVIARPSRFVAVGVSSSPDPLSLARARGSRTASLAGDKADGWRMRGARCPAEGADGVIRMVEVAYIE